MAEKTAPIPPLEKLQAKTDPLKNGVLSVTLEEFTDCIVLKAIDETGQGWPLLKIYNDPLLLPQTAAYVPPILKVNVDAKLDAMPIFEE